jgi:hypothetical protein
MSRAFVKEAETKEPRCPTPQGCGGLGVSVARATVAANLAPGSVPEFHGDIFFCSDSSCAIGYFDGFGTRVAADVLLRRAWPKDAGGVVCSCFGVDIAAIEDCAERGEKAAMKAWIERSKSSEARCATTAPDGKNCEAKLRRVFLRALGLDG